MNLFDNILKSQFNNFTGQAQPQVPSFGTPQAPRTMNYTQTNIPTTTSAKIAPVARNSGFAPGFEGTVDQTQSPVFKAVQGGANLFTGIKKRLGETVQEDKAKFDAEMSQKRQQFINDMLAKGKKKEDIFSALDSLKAKGEFDFKPGISESIVGGVGNRMQTIQDTTQNLSQIQDPLKRTASGILPFAGQTVATALQPITSALEPFVSPVVQEVVKRTGQTENIQALSEGWSEFEKTNPILAENIAGLLNVGQLAPIPFAKPIGNAIKTGTVQTGKALVRGAEVVAPKVVQGIKTGAKATGEGVGKITKSIVSQQSGLGTPAIESILKNPELQGKIRSGELSGAKTLEEARSSIDALREGYRETGKMYDTVRKSNIPVTKNEAKQILLSQLESEGLATGGKLNLVDLPVKDRGAITQALKYIDEYGDTMTPQNALSIRQKLDDLINYKSDVGSNGQRIVQGLRTKYDEFLGNKLPGLKDIDAKYAPERQFWESIRKDIYKADGTLKDNALSVVSNITNKGNEARLARMEQILPGIGEKVRALKAFDDVQAASGIKVGTYGRAATTGALALASIPLALASWVATHPVVVSRVLESIGLASQKIKAILAKGKNITKEDATIIQQAVAKTPKSKVESIINNLSYDPKTSKLTSKTLTKNANNSIRPVAIGNKGDVGKVEQVKKPLATPKKEVDLLQEKYNAEQKNAKPIIIEKKPILKPNTIKNESKVEIGKEIKTDNITIEGKKFNGNPILIDGKEVGGVSYRVYPNDAKTIELSKIEIYPEFQGNNYARKVIEKILKDNPNSKEISLSAAKTAEPIWEKLGFKFKDHITKEGKVYGISRSDFLSNIKSNAKQPRIINNASDTIPEGYIRNPLTGEIIKRPSNKTGGFIKIPEIGKKSEGIKVYKGVNGEGTGKKFPLDYFTTDKKSASQYGKEVIETTIYPKKIADFTNPKSKTELRKILRDNLNPKLADEFIDKAMEGKDSFSNPLYEMVENPKVTQALKDAGYDATKYLDYGNKNSKFARHETIAMLDVKPITKSTVKNPLVEEARIKEIDANKYIKQKNPDITLTTFEGPDEINLYRIEIPKSNRNKGAGTKVMNDLIKYADNKGKRIFLTPDNYAGSSLSRLKEFYKRFGFVENKGRNKDFSTREAMYRNPSKKLTK